MVKTANENFDDEPERCHDDEITPRTPWLLWVVVFVIVTLMIVWSIRTFGPRYQGTDATPSGQPVTTDTRQATT